MKSPFETQREIEQAQRRVAETFVAMREAQIPNSGHAAFKAEIASIRQQIEDERLFADDEPLDESDDDEAGQ